MNRKCYAVLILLITTSTAVKAAEPQRSGVRFAAEGLRAPERQDPNEYRLWNKPSVVVSFDQLPTSMRFYLPAFPCQVTENGIKHSNWWAETYDLRVSGGSFETLMDRSNKYARIWIESQNAARIVVRVRGALCDDQGRIAHTDIPSGSPHGLGDWVDEWYYIYPDGVNVRHIKIYTGLASRSHPFGIDRDPPKVVHEFGETAVMNERGHPKDHIETDALTLIRMVDDHPNRFLRDGQSKTVSYRPYPTGYGQFRDANIMLINVKSEYKPFTIGLPYGSRVSPYMAEVDPEDIFKFWSESGGYTCALGHLVNYLHYRRTEKTLEQVYLSGVTNASDPVPDVVALAWSWIAHPHLRMADLEEWRYDITYDKAQRAWIIPRHKAGATTIKFSLEEDRDMTEFGAAMWIVNPAFVVPNWGHSQVSLRLNGRMLKRGQDYRVGYERGDAGNDLVVWVKMKSQENVHFSIMPANDD